MIKLDYYDSQIVRYVKGWFGRNSLSIFDKMNDLRTIISKRNAVKPIMITDKIIIDVLLEVIRNCGGESKINISDLVSTILFGSKWGRQFVGDEKTPVERCVESLYGIIYNLPVMDGEYKILSIEDEDPKIFEYL